MTTRDDRRILAALCAVAAVLALAATWRGPGIGPDSIVYLSTGISVANGEGLTTHEGETLTLWPPGLPLIFAAGETVGIDGTTTARLLNAAAWAATVALAHLLGRRMIRRRAIRLGAITLVALSPVVEHVASLVLTEAAFIPIALACVVLVTRAWERGHTLPAEAAALVGLCWAGFLLRYAGIALIGFVAAAMLMIRWRQGAGRSLADATTLSGAALVVPLIVLLRNRQADGTLMGPRTGSTDSIIDIAHQIASTLGRWMLPSHAIPMSARVVTGTLVIAVLVTGLIRSRRDTTPAVTAMVLFTLVFSGYLVVAKLTTAFEPLDTRLMSALAVPLILLASVVVDRMPPTSGRAGRVVPVALLGFLVIQCAATLTLVIDHGLSRRHYAARPPSPITIAAAAQVTPEVAVYANDPGQFWNQTGIQPVFPAPRHTLVHGIPVSGELTRLRDRLCDGTPALLVWYRMTEVGGWQSLDELAEVVDLEELATAADGTLYRVTAPACPGSA